MTPTRELLIDLEFVLIAKLRPVFLAISNPDDSEDGSVEIVIACMQFANKTIQERVSIVFNLLSEYLPNILLEDRLLIIQTFSNSEMESVLDDIFGQEIF